MTCGAQYLEGMDTEPCTSIDEEQECSLITMVGKWGRKDSK